MKTFLISCLMLLCYFTGVAQEEKLRTFKGVLVKKEWSKSTNSYCAQGSDYYELTTKKGKSWVVKFKMKLNETGLAHYTNQKVKIKGQVVRKKIPTPKDDGMQHPVSDPIIGGGNADFECEVLMVHEIKIQ